MIYIGVVLVYLILYVPYLRLGKNYYQHSFYWHNCHVSTLIFSHTTNLLMFPFLYSNVSTVHVSRDTITCSSLHLELHYILCHTPKYPKRNLILIFIYIYINIYMYYNCLHYEIANSTHKLYSILWLSMLFILLDNTNMTNVSWFYHSLENHTIIYM